METALAWTSLFAAGVLFALHVAQQISYAPPYAPDVSLQNVCQGPRYACAYGLGVGARCVLGECASFAFGADCDAGYISETWVAALQNCAQPAFWPWFVAAAFGVWVIIAARTRYTLAVGALIEAALLCMSFGQIRAYWTVLCLALALASFTLSRVVGLGAFRTRLIETPLGLGPLAVCVTILCAMYVAASPTRYNTLVVAAVALYSQRAIAFALLHRWTKRPVWPLLLACDLATVTLVLVCYVLLVPAMWLVWPLYLACTFAGVRHCESARVVDTAAADALAAAAAAKVASKKA